MNRALFTFTVREKTSDGLHLTALATGALTLLLPAFLSWPDRVTMLAETWRTWYGILSQVLALLLGTGLIGRDIANGALMGWAARPLRRSSIYLSRLFGTCASLALYLLIALLPALVLSDGGIPWREAAGAYAAAVLSGLGLLAAIAALSIALQTYQDVAALLLAGAAASFGRRALLRHGHARIARAVRTATRLFVPDGGFARAALARGRLDLGALILYGAGMAVMISAGVWWLHRKSLVG